MRLIVLLIAAASVFFAVSTAHTLPKMKAALQARSEPFSMATLDRLRAEHRPVFVDATADWCITCKVNEAVALSSPRMLQAFSDRHVAYLVADWTHGDTAITYYLESFGRRGVPLYVYYPPEGTPVVLPQLLTESIVLKAIAHE